MKEYVSVGKLAYRKDLMAIELYVNGCRVQCPSCKDKDVWEFKDGSIQLSEILERIETFKRFINKVFITGGEPLQQSHSKLLASISMLKSTGVQVWLFTSYNMSQIPHDIKYACDYIKTGIYDPTSGPGYVKYGIKVQTKNQIIWKNGVDY